MAAPLHDPGLTGHLCCRQRSCRPAHPRHVDAMVDAAARRGLRRVPRPHRPDRPDRPAVRLRRSRLQAVHGGDQARGSSGWRARSPKARHLASAPSGDEERIRDNRSTSLSSRESPSSVAARGTRSDELALAPVCRPSWVPVAPAIGGVRSPSKPCGCHPPATARTHRGPSRRGSSTRAPDAEP